MFNTFVTVLGLGIGLVILAAVALVTFVKVGICRCAVQCNSGI